MKIHAISFSLIWGFAICQITSLTLLLSLFVLTPISWEPSGSLILGTAFSIGVIAFVSLRKAFRKLGIVGGLVTIVLFFMCAVSLPQLGRLGGDKADKVDQMRRYEGQHVINDDKVNSVDAMN